MSSNVYTPGILKSILGSLAASLVRSLARLRTPFTQSLSSALSAALWLSLPRLFLSLLPHPTRQFTFVYFLLNVSCSPLFRGPRRPGNSDIGDSYSRCALNSPVNRFTVLYYCFRLPTLVSFRSTVCRTLQRRVNQREKRPFRTINRLTIEPLLRMSSNYLGTK